MFFMDRPQQDGINRNIGLTCLEDPSLLPVTLETTLNLWKEKSLIFLPIEMRLFFKKIKQNYIFKVYNITVYYTEWNDYYSQANWLISHSYHFVCVCVCVCVCIYIYIYIYIYILLNILGYQVKFLLSKIYMQLNIYHNYLWLLKPVWKFPKILKAKVTNQTCHDTFSFSCFILWLTHSYSFCLCQGVAVGGVHLVRRLMS